jgi:hypothetical protein
MKKVARFLTLALLLGYVSLVFAEAFHGHYKGHDESQCAVCQIVHQSPALISNAPSLGFHGISTRAPVSTIFQSYVQFVFVAHGLSPPAF